MSNFIQQFLTVFNWTMSDGMSDEVHYLSSSQSSGVYDDSDVNMSPVEKRRTGGTYTGAIGVGHVKNNFNYILNMVMLIRLNKIKITIELIFYKNCHVSSNKCVFYVYHPFFL